MGANNDMRQRRSILGIFAIPIVFLLMAAVFYYSNELDLSAVSQSARAESAELPLPAVRSEQNHNAVAEDQQSLPNRKDDSGNAGNPEGSDPSSISAGNFIGSQLSELDEELILALATLSSVEVSALEIEPGISCSDIWGFESLPDDLPHVLTDIPSAEELKTDLNYYYLAAMLIHHKAIDASHCAQNGLQSATIANQCGVEAASSMIMEWQNQYDQVIFEASTSRGIPPRLLKQMFAVESQFWPGIYPNFLVGGLGHLNEIGADALLLYNPAFFSEFCPGILHPSTCDLGYGKIDTNGKRLLRGALVQQVNAACDTCEFGINNAQAVNSIPVFAEVLKANCRQVGQLVENLTGGAAHRSASYTDLWKITMANYNAGPGCTAVAIKKALDNGSIISWETVSRYFTDPGCNKVFNYVQDIFK